jgi:hypothetical protein
LRRSLRHQSLGDIERGAANLRVHVVFLAQFSELF